MKCLTDFSLYCEVKPWWTSSLHLLCSGVSHVCLTGTRQLWLQALYLQDIATKLQTFRGKCRYLFLKVKATGHCRGIKLRPHQDWQHGRLEGGSVAVSQRHFLAQYFRLCSVTFHFNSGVLSDPNQWMGVWFKMKSANIVETFVPT